MNNVQHKNIPKEYQHIPFKWIVDNGADRRSIESPTDKHFLYQISTQEIYIALDGEFHVLGIGYPKEDNKMYLLLNNEWVRLEDHLYEDFDDDKTFCAIGTRAIKNTKLHSYDYDISYRPKQCVNLPKLATKGLHFEEDGDRLLIVPKINNALLIGDKEISNHLLYLSQSNILNEVYMPNSFLLKEPILETNSEYNLNLRIINDTGYTITVETYDSTIELKNKEAFMITINSKDLNWNYYEHGICSLPRYWSHELE